MNDRLSTDKYFLNIAEVVAQRGTCVRRKVGCVLVDSNNHIVATGYNGVAKKFPHCIDQPCEGADYPSGEGLDKCEAIHAELNAFLQLRSDDTSLSMYTTTTPCRECTRDMQQPCKESGLNFSILPRYFTHVRMGRY